MSLLADIANRTRKIGKAGRRAERAVLKSYGASAVPASGAANAKGDGELPRFLLEIKSTKANSFRVTREVLSKITGEAHSTGLDPALVIAFTDETGSIEREGNWVCIPREVFEEITDGS